MDLIAWAQRIEDGFNVGYTVTVTPYAIELYDGMGTLLAMGCTRAEFIKDVRDAVGYWLKLD